MEVFKPFCGYTYFNKFKKQNNFSRYVCPYNFEVFLKKENKNLVKNEYNVFNFKEEKEGLNKIKNWIQNSILVPFKVPCFYIYEMSYKISEQVYTLTGIVGQLKLPEQGENYINCCEKTLKDEVDYNFNFIKNSSFFSSPVCVLCNNELETKNMNLIRKKMSSSYIFKAKQNNVVHKLWRVEEKEIIDVLVDFFKNKDYYVISGTEKYESAIKYRDFLRENSKKEDLNFKNSFMALVFLKSDFCFAALPVHRLISGINMFFGEEILKKASKYFDVNPCKSLDSMRSMLFNFRRNEQHAFGIYADGFYNVLALKDKKVLEEFLKNNEEFEKFDSFMVDEFFLKKVLGLNSSNISYCSVDKNASDAVDCGDACFALYLSAVRSEDLFKILGSKNKFPEKSFSFFPKPVEGLLFYNFY